MFVRCPRVAPALVALALAYPGLCCGTPSGNAVADLNVGKHTVCEPRRVSGRASTVVLDARCPVPDGPRLIKNPLRRCPLGESVSKGRRGREKFEV